MCADDTTIFAGDGEDIGKAKEAIQCYVDASSASINWKKTISFLSGCLLTNPPPQDIIPGKVMGPQDKARYLGAIVSRDTNVVPWENTLAKAQRRMAFWSKRGLTIHNRVIIARLLMIPTVSYVLTDASTNSRAVNVPKQQINRFLWDDPYGKKKPLVDRATLTLPDDGGGLNCPLFRDIADARRLALWFRALYSREDWA